MKNSKKVFNNAGQSIVEVKKSQKHDANLQKNSTLYFQIGLILCLLGTYALFEMQFQDKKYIPDSISIDEVAVVDVAPPYQVEVVQQKKPEPKVDRSSRLIDEYVEVEDTTTKIEDKIFTPDAPEPSDGPVKIDDIKPFKKPVEVIVPFVSIEEVPVYPGCEKYQTNDERKKCMSKKISKLVGKRFNTNIANDYGITGLQKIQTQFTVDKHGNVTDIKIRGPHPALEEEAKRVIDKIPHMKPGMQRKVPVGVIYTLPIKFEVRN